MELFVGILFILGGVYLAIAFVLMLVAGLVLRSMGAMVAGLVATALPVWLAVHVHEACDAEPKYVGARTIYACDGPAGFVAHLVVWIGCVTAFFCIVSTIYVSADIWWSTRRESGEDG